jgi:hypothetical protein
MLVSAVIMVCLASAPTSCERHEFRIEARACHLPEYRAEIPMAGAMYPATVRIVCEPPK